MSKEKTKLADGRERQGIQKYINTHQKRNREVQHTEHLFCLPVIYS
jgi:hypothetical protein